MGRRKDRIAKEDYSSDSGGSEEDEEQGDYAEFESFTQPFRRKKRRHGKKSKEDAMLGIFGDGSSDDDRDLMHKNIRYKEVNFVEKADDEEESKSQKEDEEDEKEVEPPSFRRGGGLGFRQAQQESPASEDIDQDDIRPTMGLGARNLRGRSNDDEDSYNPVLGFNQARSPNEDENVYRPAFGFNQSRSAEFESTFANHTTTQS